MLEYQNIKMFLQNVFVIKEVKKTVLWTYVISDLECYTKKNCKIRNCWNVIRKRIAK